jgi:hypothetical protein
MAVKISLPVALAAVRVEYSEPESACHGGITYQTPGPEFSLNTQADTGGGACQLTQRIDGGSDHGQLRLQ